MHNLTKSYNRKYYRNVLIVKTTLHWKLFKLSIIKFLLKLCLLVDAKITNDVMRISQTKFNGVKRK